MRVELGQQVQAFSLLLSVRSRCPISPNMSKNAAHDDILVMQGSSYSDRQLLFPKTGFVFQNVRTVFP